MTSKNLYHRRLVADSSSKACWICFRPSSTVLITPEQDDWFHICPGHLSDRKFAIAQDEADVAAKKREEELEKEMAAVKKEFEEKMRKKLARRKQKEHEKANDGKKGDAAKKEDADDEKERDEKLAELEKKKEGPVKTAVEGPRIFVLDKSFYQMRLQKKRDVETAKRNREALRSRGGFPSVPQGGLG